jgi:hypothetical protein
MHTINRSSGFEEILDSLVTRITGIEHFKHHTGCSFVNDIFELHPYYFGKCLCSYKKEYDSFILNNPHKSDCFKNEIKTLNEAFKNHKDYNNCNKLKAIRANEERRLCIAHNIKYNDGKCLTDICNCGVDDNFNKLEINHEIGCPSIMPNFWFKKEKEEVKIYWYKTYFRDAKCNINLTLSNFNKIISDCIGSV